MFKKLRNKLLMINLLITAALIAGSFSCIFVITAHNVLNDIDDALNGALGTMTENGRAVGVRNFAPEETPPPVPSSDPQPPEGTPDMPEGTPPAERKDGTADDEHSDRGRRGDDPFSSILKYTIDDSGNIKSHNITIKITDEDILSEINTVISEIIASGKNAGHITVSGTTLEYKVRPFSEGHAVVFGEFSTEHAYMQRLFIILIIVALFAMALAFFVSLISANNAIKPIEESYNKQKQFIADASHELKTPLTTISTNVDVLLSHEDSPIREEKKWLLYIKGETERMAKLTNDLLYLARVDHNDKNVIYGETSFSDAVESVLLTMEAVAFERLVVVDEKIEENIMVKASPDQLKQLIMILMDNAIKYTPENGRINVLLKRGKNAVFSVRNSGEGIDKEDMKHIFERFYRSDKSRARESGGYGLGLAIAKAITDSFGGDIKVSSEPGKYTEFTVSLPIA